MGEEGDGARALAFVDEYEALCRKWSLMVHEQEDGVPYVGEANASLLGKDTVLARHLAGLREDAALWCV